MTGRLLIAALVALAAACAPSGERLAPSGTACVSLTYPERPGDVRRRCLRPRDVLVVDYTFSVSTPGGTLSATRRAEVRLDAVEAPPAAPEVAP